MELQSFNWELLFGIIGTITGVSSFIIAMHYNRKAIKQADKALDQADKNLKTQLLYEDKKQALMNLQKIIDETKSFKLKNKINTFLHSFEGNYIPNEVIRNIKNEIKELDEYYEQNSPYPSSEMREEEHNYYVKNGLISEDPYEGLDHYEIFDYNYNCEIESAKYSIKNIINNALKDV